MPVLTGTPSYIANTVVIFEGPSLIDGAPIVVFLTGLEEGSSNRKTGFMLQTYILRADVPPMEALWTGADKSICGGCIHRPQRDLLEEGRLIRTCYVQVGQAPRSMYEAYKHERYRSVPLEKVRELCSERFVRLGAYGDPAAVPMEVWDAALVESAGHTGYTHQWRARKFAALKRYCQASVDSDVEYAKAAAAGWGTFLVRPQGDLTVGPNQHLCPASAEAGKVTTCERCLRCGGEAAAERFGTLQHVMIPAHGATAGHVKER